MDQNSISYRIWQLLHSRTYYKIKSFIAKQFVIDSNTQITQFRKILSEKWSFGE